MSTTTTERPEADVLDHEAEHSGLDFVTFVIGEELFALPMDRVHEIIRMPSVVHVPLGPPSLKGLANLRGKVLPVVDLRSCCGFEEREYDDATRVVVVDCGVPLGFAVDRVASVLSVDADALESTDGLQHTLKADLLKAVIRTDSRMIEVLDIDHLSKVEYQIAASSMRRALSDQTGDVVDDDAAEVLELVSFVVDGQEYSLPIDDVQEIVQAPERLVAVPNVDPRVRGVMSLRGRLLPVVGLRRVFGLAEEAMRSSDRIIVVPLTDEDGTPSGAAGLLVDSVRKVLRIPLDLVSPLPDYLASSGRATEVERVCRLDEGDRLVSVLSVDRVFVRDGLQRAVIEAAGATDEGPSTAGEVDADTATDDEQALQDGDVTMDDAQDQALVVFRLGGEEYGVDVDAVQEIIRVPEQLVSVPQSLSFVEGLVNLRGIVLPVVDLRSRLGIPRLAREDRQRIVVLDQGGTRTGFIVDSVAEVMKLSDGLVEDAPTLSEEQAELINKVVNHSDRMLLILDADNLVTNEERALLDQQPAL